MVYQDHLAKFIVLRPLRHKSAQEVVYFLMEIFCLLGAPHILQSDNGRDGKRQMARLKIIHGKPKHPQLQGSVERVNREIKVLSREKSW